MSVVCCIRFPDCKFVVLFPSFLQKAAVLKPHLLRKSWDSDVKIAIKPRPLWLGKVFFFSAAIERLWSVRLIIAASHSNYESETERIFD
jgi:hypothetical protein